MYAFKLMIQMLNSIRLQLQALGDLCIQAKLGIIWLLRHHLASCCLYRVPLAFSLRSQPFIHRWSHHMLVDLVELHLPQPQTLCHCLWGLHVLYDGNGDGGGAYFYPGFELEH